MTQGQVGGFDPSRFQKAFQNLGGRVQAGQGNLQAIQNFLNTREVAALAGLFFESDAFSQQVLQPVREWGAIPLAGVPIYQHSGIEFTHARALRNYNEPTDVCICVLGITMDDTRKPCLSITTTGVKSYEDGAIAAGLGMTELRPGSLHRRKLFGLNPGDIAHLNPQVVVDGFAQFLEFAAGRETVFGPNRQARQDAETALQECRRTLTDASQGPAIRGVTPKRLPRPKS